jgi:hypothetical protein
VVFLLVLAALGISLTGWAASAAAKTAIATSKTPHRGYLPAEQDFLGGKLMKRFLWTFGLCMLLAAAAAAISLSDRALSAAQKVTQAQIDQAQADAKAQAAKLAAQAKVYEATREHLGDEIPYERHESGPELLFCLAMWTATISLAKEVIKLVTAIINARSEGQKQGDRHHEAIELIVRDFDKDGKMFEERVLRIQQGHEPNREMVKRASTDGLTKRLGSDTSGIPRAKSKGNAAKRKGKK